MSPLLKSVVQELKLEDDIVEKEIIIDGSITNV